MKNGEELTEKMAEDNTPTVTARRRKPTQNLRIRLETARRLQSLNARTKARRAAAKHASSKSDTDINMTREEGKMMMTAPRIPKIKKNKLSHPAPADAKYRKRQRCKTWLPTHMFHAKRAHMTPPSQPLWRFAVPISPTEKSYRPSHRARTARGALAWDMSYMATVLIEGTDAGLEAVLRGLGVDGDEAWGRKGSKWREGTRVLQTWVFELPQEDSFRCRRPMAPVTLIQQAREQGKEQQVGARGGDRKIFIRIHPSAFFQLWQALLDLAKRQTPSVTVEDLRFDIGSIEITGPGSTEALNSVLQPDPSSNFPTEAETPRAAFDSDGPELIWRSLLGISNPSTLPQGALLAFTILDPRLRSPRAHDDDGNVHMKEADTDTDAEHQAKLLASWPPDRTQGPAGIFHRPARLAASRQLPSQKAINRRRALAGPGRTPERQPTDPQIPVLLFASRPMSSSGGGGSSTNLTGSWTVLLPWKCVLPVWSSLLYHPLSSGGNPRFGGLQELQQTAFEAGEPWFPGDFPGTAAGWEWDQLERKRVWQEWSRRPKGRRVEFNRLRLQLRQPDEHGLAGEPKDYRLHEGEVGEFGRGWACDWERLLQSQDGHRDESILEKADQPDSNPSTEFNPLPPEIYQVRSHNVILRDTKENSSVRGALATVRITLQGRGTPAPRARIYRLPDEPGLRTQWMRNNTSHDSRRSGGGSGSESDGGSGKGCDIAGNNNREQTKLMSCWTGFESGTDTDAGTGIDKSPAPLLLPGDDAIIGFVTSGGYNLATGQGTGIGSIALSRLASAKSKLRPLPTTDFCIVRRAGEPVGRLARYTFV